VALSAVTDSGKLMEVTTWSQLVHNLVFCVFNINGFTMGTPWVKKMHGDLYRR